MGYLDIFRRGVEEFENGGDTLRRMELPLLPGLGFRAPLKNLRGTHYPHIRV
jgi:hypothetical protein